MARISSTTMMVAVVEATVLRMRTRKDRADLRRPMALLQPKGAVDASRHDVRMRTGTVVADM